MAHGGFKGAGARSSAIFVIGVSAGGMDALTKLVSQLPEDFPAPIFIVCHMSADTTGDALVGALRACGKIIESTTL
jgi:two-component system, chemotaxis family, protein-glutamate methylesterase/glutaminase